MAITLAIQFEEPMISVDKDVLKRTMKAALRKEGPATTRSEAETRIQQETVAVAL